MTDATDCRRDSLWSTLRDPLVSTGLAFLTLLGIIAVAEVIAIVTGVSFVIPFTILAIFTPPTLIHHLY